MPKIFNSFKSSTKMALDFVIIAVIHKNIKDSIVIKRRLVGI